MKRRRFLHAVLAGSGLVAGCVGTDPGSDGPSPTSTEQSSTDTPATSTEPTTGRITATETANRTTTARMEMTATTSAPTDDDSHTRRPETVTQRTSSAETPTRTPVACGDGLHRFTPPIDEVRYDTLGRFELAANRTTLALGDQVTIRLENTTDATRTTGNDRKYDIQRRTEEGWQSIYWLDGTTAWSDGGFMHRPGEGFEWELVLTRNGLERERNAGKTYRACELLRPGTYRFVYWSVSPTRENADNSERTYAIGVRVTVEKPDTDPTLATDRNSLRATTVPEPTTADAGTVQRRVSLARVENVPDEHEVSINVERLESTVTTEHTARVQVTTTNEGSERRITVGTGGCGLFNRGKGASDQEGLWLHRAGTTEYIDRVDDRWTADRNSDDPRLFDAYGCVYDSVAHDESIVNEYLVWDDYQVEGYMTPGTYRFAEKISIYGPESDPEDDPEVSFPWGFSLAVETPNA